MLRGNFQTRTDEKGRLKLPADFRRELEERYGSTQYYITSRDGETAELYGMEEWEKIEKKLAALPSSNKHRKKFLGVTNYYGQVIEIDGQGRILLPALLRDKANLKGEVAVVGVLDHLELKNWEAYTRSVEENQLNDEDADALSALGI